MVKDIVFGVGRAGKIIKRNSNTSEDDRYEKYTGCPVSK